MLTALSPELLINVLKYLHVFELRDLEANINNIQIRNAVISALDDLGKTMCPGCFHEEPGQLAHMEPGGCLS